MSKTESLVFQNLGDPGQSRITLDKKGNSYILNLEEPGWYGINIELSEQQIRELIEGLKTSIKEAADIQDDQNISQPKHIRLITENQDDPIKNGFVLIKVFHGLIGLTIVDREGGDIEPYFSIDACKEIIALMKRICRG